MSVERRATHGGAYGLCLAVSALLLASSASAEQSYRSSRPVLVQEPGWIAVELEEPAARSGTVQVLNPQGQLMDLYQLPAGAVSRPARIVELEELAAGWQIVIDLGASPPLHSRLHFELRSIELANRCLLEGSFDRQGWEQLTEGSLFRIGGFEGGSRATLDYPEGRWRYLRLHWPRSAGLPEVRQLGVSTTARLREVEIEPTDCSLLADGRSRCWLAVPHGLDQLHLEVDDDGRYGYWVSFFGENSVPGSRHGWFEGSQLALAPTTEESDGLDSLRIDIWSAAGPGPRVLGAQARFRPTAVVFRAATAGRYQLVSGGLEPSQTRGAGPAEAASAAWLESGQESLAPWPRLPPTVVEPRVELAQGWSHRWRIEAPAAHPDELVELSLPSQVLALISDLGELRLKAGGQQIPYTRPLARRWRSAALHTGLTPSGSAPSFLDLELSRSPTAFLELFSRQTLFDKTLHGTLSDDLSAARQSPRRPAFQSTRWRCQALRPAGCARRLQMTSEGFDKLRLEFEDGDNPALDEVSVERWQLDTRLVFVWPAGGEVSLVRYAEASEPQYDLQELARVVDERPRAPAMLGLSEPAASDRWHWLLPASYSAAALVLLWLLRRLLREPTDPRTAPKQH